MNILIDLINNPTAILQEGLKIDYRYDLLIKLADYFLLKNHNVYIYKLPGSKIDNKDISKYKQYNHINHKSIINLYICFSPFKEGKERFDWYKNKIPYLCYEHGWLNQSIYMDRKGVFGDSVYVDNIDLLINNNYNKTECDKYRTYLINNNISKRLQNNIDIIPPELIKKYIFVPLQKPNDLSIIKYSKISMFDFSIYMIKYADKYKIPIIFKLHPHVNINSYKKIINLINKSEYCYLFNLSIYELINNSIFTACINSGSIIDNLICTSPIYCCGKSFFYKSKAIIFNENINEGLDIMINKKYDYNIMIDTQLKLLWWLKQSLLSYNNSIDENIKRLEYHINLKF
jgi:hypothetical protein